MACLMTFLTMWAFPRFVEGKLFVAGCRGAISPKQERRDTFERLWLLVDRAVDIAAACAKESGCA